MTIPTEPGANTRKQGGPNNLQGSCLPGGYLSGSLILRALAAASWWYGSSTVARLAGLVSGWCAAAIALVVSGSLVVRAIVKLSEGPGENCVNGAFAMTFAARAAASIRRILHGILRLPAVWWRESLAARGLSWCLAAPRRLKATSVGGSSLAVSALAWASDALVSYPSGVLLALVVAALPFAPTSMLLVASAGLAAIRVLGWAAAEARGACLARGPADIAALFFCLSVALSAATSASRMASVTTLALWIGYAGIFLASSSLKTPGRVVRLVAFALVLSALLVSAIGILQFFKGAETPASWIDTKVFEDVKTRVYSVFDNPNVCAEFLSFALPLAVALMLSGPGPVEIAFLIPAIGIISVCLAMTMSRGGWVATAIGVAVVVFARDRRLMVLCLVVAIIAVPLLPESIRTRAVTAFTLQDSSSRYRLTIWKSGLRMARDYWASGVGLGMGAFSYVYPAYEIAGTPAVHTHNLYLQTLVEMGVPGLLLFLWLLLCFTREVWKMVSGGALIPVALVGAIAGQAAHGMIDNIWYSPKVVLLFWAIFGLALATSRERSPA